MPETNQPAAAKARLCTTNAEILKMFDYSRMISSLLLCAVLIAAALVNAVAADNAPAPAAGTERNFSEENISYDFALGLLKRGLNVEAAKEFGQFIERFPASPKINAARLNRAEAYFNNRQFPEAARDYQHYQQTPGSDQKAPRLRYGICLYELKQYQDALTALAPLRQGSNELAESAAYYAALCLRQSGKTAEAVAALKTVTSSQMQPSALYALAEIMLDEKNYQSAAAYLGQIIERYPAHHLAEKSRLVRANALRLNGDLAASSGDFAQLINSLDPQLQSRARYGLAWTRYGENKLPQAKELLAQIMQNPGEFASGANYLLGSIAFRENDFSAALQFFKKVEDKEFAPKAALASAWAYYNLKDYTAAINEITRCTRLFPDFSEQELHYLAGRCLWHLEKFAEAAGEFRYALKFDGARKPQAAYELALSCQKAAQFPEAADAFNYFIKTYPDNPLIAQARDGLGNSLMRQGRYEAAAAVYSNLLQTAAQNSPQKEQYLHRLAVCYYYLKQYSNMELTYKQLLTDYPRSAAAPDALFWLGWHYGNSSSFAEAVKCYDRLLQEFSTHPLAEKGRYYLGLTRLRSGDHDKAAAVFYELAATNSKSIQPQELLWLAQHLDKTGQYPKAAEVYKLLLQDPEPTLVRGVALRGQAEILQKQNLWEAALAEWEKLAALAPKIQAKAEIINALRNDACYGAALCLRQLKRFAAARSSLEKIKIADDDPFAAKLYYQRGMLDFAEGKYQAAAGNLMRVGMLVADEELAGSALLTTAEACEKLADSARALICYQELAGKLEGSYGQLYPQSPYTLAGKKKLQELNAANPKPETTVK